MAFQKGGTSSRGSGLHSAAPALGGLRLLPVHGVGAPACAPLTPRRGRRKKAARAPHPDSSPSLSLPGRRPRPEAPPPPPTSPGSTRKHTLHAPHPPRPEVSASRAPAGEEGPRWGTQLRTSEGTWAPRLSPPALHGQSAPRCPPRADPAPAPRPRLGQYPQGRWRRRRHARRLSAEACDWLAPRVRRPRIGRERRGGGGGAAAAWSREWAKRREQRPQAPGAARSEAVWALGAAAW